MSWTLTKEYNYREETFPTDREEVSTIGRKIVAFLVGLFAAPVALVTVRRFREWKGDRKEAQMVSDLLALATEAGRAH